MARPNSGGTFGERAGIGAKGNFVSILFNMGWVEGFEPSATGTTIRRSTKLSYAHRVEFKTSLPNPDGDRSGIDIESPSRCLH